MAVAGRHSLACTRRAAMAGGLAAAAWPLVANVQSGPDVVAGTYAREGGQGLYPLTVAGADWAVGPPLPAFADVSFGVRATRSGMLYLLAETARGTLTVCDRAYRPLATRSTLGAGPAHAALSPDQSAVAIANYSSGTVALWRLDRATGLPQGDGQLAQHDGHGPNAARQAGPHAHWVGFSPDARWLHAVDLGADAIFAHRYAADTRTLGAMRIAYRAPPGTGPRHLARHPLLPVVYLVSELANTLTVLHAQDDGRFAPMASLSTLPAGSGGASAAAHIAVNAAGTRLYVSNRGHNSIAVFALDRDGLARVIQHVDCGGDWPRFFLLIEPRRALLVANERSGTVTRFRIEPDGRLRAAPGHLAIPGIAFLAAV